MSHGRMAWLPPVTSQNEPTRPTWSGLVSSGLPLESACPKASVTPAALTTKGESLAHLTRDQASAAEGLVCFLVGDGVG